MPSVPKHGLLMEHSRGSSARQAGWLIGAVRFLLPWDRRTAALREAEERFRLAFDNAPIGMALTSLDGCFLQVNEALGDMLGRRPESLVGMTVPSLTHPDDQEADRIAMLEMREGKRTTFAAEKRYLRADGELVWVRLHAAVVVDGTGQPMYFVSQMDDITARRAAEAALRESEERFRLLAENASDLIIRSAPDGIMLYVSPACRRILGYEPEEMVGRSVRDFVVAPDRDIAAAARSRVLDGDETILAVTGVRRKDGTVAILEATGHRVVNPDSEELVEVQAICRDVTERKAMEEELRRLATMDELTGLRNRRGFLSVAEPLARVARRNQVDMTLLFIDLDDLKKINDRHGHAAGDRALVKMADLLQVSFRESDVLARLGGDEFAVLIPQDGVDVKVYLDRLQAHLDERNRAFPELSFSLGTAEWRWDRPVSVEALIDQADAVMYREKEGKRSGAAQIP